MGSFAEDQPSRGDCLKKDAALEDEWHDHHENKKVMMMMMWLREIQLFHQTMRDREWTGGQTGDSRNQSGMTYVKPITTTRQKFRIHTAIIYYWKSTMEGNGQPTNPVDQQVAIAAMTRDHRTSLFSSYGRKTNDDFAISVRVARGE
jgi:hypothetical protein